MSIEQLAKTLNDLYRGYGYLPYTMSKFEEYELYLRNKDFLVSDRVLTFTDTDGKLMALKPDVTLSIIKNTVDAPGEVQKVCYREHVYRPGKNDQGFREIMQVGLECMGSVDNYCIFEVLLLAVKSLQTISHSCILDVSHRGLVARLLDEAGMIGAVRDRVLEAIGNKNAHEIRSICEENGTSGEKLARLCIIGGSASSVLPQLDEMFGNAPELVQLKQLLTGLDKAGVDCVNVDFSVVNNMTYYNGIVFRGFIEGIPEGVLSGGQYDVLMEKMKRSGKAIGFALYPDQLERMTKQSRELVDAVLYYDKTADISVIAAAVDSFVEKNIHVIAQPDNGSIYRTNSYRLVGSEVIANETNA